MFQRSTQSFGPILADRATRALEMLADLDLERLVERVRSAREVAVLPYAQGRIALKRDPSGYRVAGGAGSGPEACRRVLRALFGSGQGRIRLLDRDTGFATLPAIETWLAEGIIPDGEEGTALAWVELAELAENVLNLSIEQQSIVQIDRDRSYKEWKEKFESIKVTTQAFDAQVLALARTLRNDGHAVRVALRESGLPPEQLVVELTETSVAEDPTRAEDQLSVLRGLGVSVPGMPTATMSMAAPDTHFLPRSSTGRTSPAAEPAFRLTIRSIPI